LTDKVTATASHKLILAHMPLIMVCLEGLGKLAEKFPKLSKESSDCLREFLTAPSQILARLSRHYNRIENYVNSNSKKSNLPALTVTESSESIKSIKQYADGPDRKYNASWQAFEKLRDCAIYNLCRSIRAQ
jgi:phosphatidylinositol 4-kinase